MTIIFWLTIILHWQSVLTGAVLFLFIRDIARLIKEIRDGDSDETA